MKTRYVTVSAIFFVILIFSGCKNNDMPNEPMVQPKNPDMAEKVNVDRFSSNAGTLFVRDAANGLPGANQPINCDQGPFITEGLGPAGEMVKYYNFDVMSTTPAPIFVLFKEGADTPVDGQLNIIDVIPGDAGYNDFWHVNKVTVPADYAANTVASLQEISYAGYTITTTNMIVNCPVVPEGSTANLKYGGGSSELIRGWYRDKVVLSEA